MKIPRIPVFRNLCRAGIGITLLPALVIRADSFVYTGNATAESPATGNWNSDTNWADGIMPASSLDTELTFGGSDAGAYTATNNFAGTFSLNKITFNSSSSGLVTLAGGTLGFLTNSASATPRITQNGSGPVSIGSALTLTNLLTIDGTGTGTLSLTGVLSGASGLTMSGAGTTVLSNNNTMTGVVTVNSGTLRATGNANALGTGAASLTLAGGNLELTNAANTNFARAVTVTGDATVTTDRTTSGAGLTHTLGTVALNSGSKLTVAGGSNVTSGTAGLTLGAITLNGNATLEASNPTGGGATQITSAAATALGANTLTVQGNGNTTLSGVVGGTGGITKAGAGIMTLSGSSANTYTGVTAVNGGELILNKSASGTNAIVGNITIAGGTLSLGQQNQIADTSAMTITDGGTFKLGGRGETLASITISSSSPGAVATIDLGNAIGSPALILNSNLTLGDNTALVGGGTIRRTGGNLTLNLNGGQVSGDLVSIGSLDAGSIINITKNAGNGSGTLSLGTSSSITTGTVNLNHTGSIDLGVKIIAQSNTSGSTSNAVNINVANTATGMSGGIITTALLADISNPAGPNRVYNTANNQLVFASGGSGFNLSGGVLDVRSMVTSGGTLTTAGSITTNGNSLTISGGSLLGNRLVASSGAITLSGGLLALRDTRAASADHFTISTTDGSNGRTIKMLSGNTGTFSVSNATATTNYIAIGAQSSGGTWDRGTLNAGTNYTITADTSGASAFGSAFSSYTIGANSGLNGLALGSTALPTQLFLGDNSSFFVSSSTAAARTYNIGTDSGTNDIVVTNSGAFAFGVNNTNSSNAQVINLNRDKGNANVTLLANGLAAGNAINLATNQTGSGNLYVATRNLTLNSGVTFGGTGGIYTDLLPGDATAQNILGGGLVNVNGSGSVALTFTINGTLNGVNTISLNQDTATNAGTFVIGSTATIGGTQTWIGGHTQATGTILTNNLTDASRWTGNVSFTAAGTYGTLEASTSVASPSTSSNYKFSSLSLQTVGTAPTGAYKLVNNTQNDGGSGKEAFYASSFFVGGGIGDGSNGHYVFNLNGQDLFVDRFNNVTGTANKGLTFQNDASGSTSVIRAVGTTGDTLVMGGFNVLNGATLEVNGGNVSGTIFNRNTGGIAADSAAAPNGGTGVGSNTFVKQTLLYNGVNGDIGTFTSFLGSGTATGGNGSTTGSGTGGTLRIVGGDYVTSGYILNPIGAGGLIDTTNGTTDTTLNTVTIRANTAADTNGVSNATVFPALVVAGTATINGHLTLADATGATNQATLRVGGVTASVTPVESGTAVLNVAGNLTTGSTNNVAIQSNGTVKVGGNVAIAGIGANLANNVTGTGVGIHANSHFTLNGNTGSATPQTVNIVPTVGNFHVGDGSAGTLTGVAAQAVLAANLTSASGVDINGGASRLNLGGFTLTANGSGLAVGGALVGNGSVSGATSILSGGSIHAADTVGLLSFANSVAFASGSAINIAINGATTRGTDYSAVNFNGGLTVSGGALTFNFGTTLADSTVLNLFDGSAFTSSLTSVSAAGSYNGGFSLNEGGTAYVGVFGAQELTFTLATGELSFAASSVIPEPSSFAALFGLAAAGFAAVRRRRNA